MTGHPPFPSDTSRHRGALGRDAALGRISRVTWWIAAGAAGLTVALIGLVAHDVPGHSAGATVVPGSTSPSASGGKTSAPGGPSNPAGGGTSSPADGGSSDAGGGFSSPPSSPAPTSQAPVARSGQS